MDHTELRLFQDAHVLDDFTDKQVSILVAAIDVFATKGYANTSTKEIAKQAGVSEGNIFNKFTNKRGLLDAIIEPVIYSIFPSTMQDLVQSSPSDDFLTLHAFVDAFIRNRLEFLYANEKVLKILISELAYDNQTRSDFFDNLPKEIFVNLNQELDQLKDRHMLIDWPNPEIIRIIITMTGGLALGRLFFDQTIKDSEVTHTVNAMTKALAK
ncbi:TetR/AcrR family transcriptional regulator [Pediococcus argentinicus]|uniref:TetR family transcriptional regulator n=1 Tax=Pediococcus argentinicus TaxID=480391 RepID=A0A0R2NGF4_9LACO|nr:TetR/AcrR family transcriptional regulator [Pediococcus argentinicus]KRO24885.1 TetR family transcriptional regulator [Pediococcus argentinicus]GEP19757.1 TetR family transcriptional regulator [Pediococcus argentinicus]